MTGEDTTSDRDGHGMGDERSGDAPGRRHARPEETLRGRTARDGRQTYDDSPLEALLGAALRGEQPDGAAERRAVAAFRAARDTGAHRARTRRRDDWRPRSQRRRTRSLKATLSVLLASLTLGGVAYAAIGSAGGGEAKGAAGGKDVRPSVSASTPAESHSSARPTASAPAERPPTAKDTLAHCRAYEKLRGRGKALDSTAYQRLVTAAGGEANVSAYCATLTGTGAADANDAADAKPGQQKPKASDTQNADKNKPKKQ
ncbi:hypothetical protein [Streptomyces canus]|uniref:hypothetical protein n=1 Tax=Streptomyces canus TaxID=58343 RepID=UPI00224E8114|nr:hypothetical protein [Streptomyces canus]MCX4857544.1 hypothetical protein [Streptomyces canus]